MTRRRTAGGSRDMGVDHVLKLYSETIRSPYLHYGFWPDPAAADPAATSLKAFIEAQQRYIDHLAGFIPADVRSILDVGCGIGGNAAFLSARGYQVETLSPDAYQEQVIRERFNGSLPFHRTKFEHFVPERRYDLILESESACYIRMQPGFQKALECLRPGGYLLASDYFIHYQDGSESPHLRSAHRLDRYLQLARESGLVLVREYDQTENTMPTLDFALAFYRRFIAPTLAYGLRSARRKYPKSFWLLERAFGPAILRKNAQLHLIDSQEFRKYRRYMIFLFRKPGPA